MPSFPFSKQRDSADCGPACLKMISKYYGKNYPIEFLREKSYITNRGVSLLGLSQAAEHIGFQTQGVKLTWEQLRDQVPLPCIVHWHEHHFIVIYRITKGRKEKVHVADPAHGLLIYDKADFVKSWGSPTGVALLIEPSLEFYNRKTELETKRHLAIRYLLNYLTPYKRYIFQLFLGLLTGTLLSLAFPFLTQSIVDFGISSSDVSFILMILLAQLLLTVGQTVNGLIQSWITLHITSRVSIKLISGFLAKMMRLPISFFYSRTIGDIMQRINDQARIQTFITGSLINILFALITIVTFSFILMYYHLLVLVVFYAGSFLYVAWITFFLKRRADLDYKRFNETAGIQNNLVQLVNGMQEIRLNDAEKQKRWEWERLQARMFKISVKGLTLNQTQSIGSAFIDHAKNIVITFLSAKAVIDGEMTLGMMMSIQYIVGQLNAPVQQFVGFIQSAQDAKISVDRLDEIYAQEDEETVADRKLSDIPAEAGIAFRNVTFQYEGPESEKVLNDATFDIPNRKVTAIVGLSGSGKTTILKLLLGIYRTTGGEILLDGRPLTDYSPASWRRACAAVMQEGYIFSDSIENNIGVSDDYPRLEQVKHAAHTASIAEFVNALPVGYKTRIGIDGHGLSTGQKQRILIARAAYRNTPFLLLDEATNALDSKNESTIKENLDQLFKDRTVVVVAHRLSTIRNADQILVLQNGKIVEKGTHATLMDANGPYRNLIEAQL